MWMRLRNLKRAPARKIVIEHILAEDVQVILEDFRNWGLQWSYTRRIEKGIFMDFFERHNLRLTCAENEFKVDPENPDHYTIEMDVPPRPVPFTEYEQKILYNYLVLPAREMVEKKKDLELQREMAAYSTRVKDALK